MKHLIFLLYPLLACVLTAILTWVAIPAMEKLNIVAHTGGRHIHKKITPTAGGIAMIIAFLITVTVFIFHMRLSHLIVCHDMLFLKLFIPLCILVPTGLIDDKYGMKARYKFMIQILTALLCWKLGIKFDTFLGYDLPVFAEIIITVIWVVGFINAFNLIDGLDGLAAGISLISSVCLAIVILLRGDVESGMIMLCMAGICLGFLKYNFYPARIFMGDTGSMFLGYMFAAVGMISSTKEASFSAVAIPILAGGVPLIDTILSIWRRVTFKMLTHDENIGIMTADCNHIHHRLLNYNKKNQSRTALYIYLIALLLGLTGILISFCENKIPGIALVLLLFSFVMVVKSLATVELWNSTQLLFQGFKTPRTSVMLCMMHPVWDLLVIGVSGYIAALIFDKHIMNYIYYHMLYNIFPLMVFLALARNYRVFWVRADEGEYMSLIKTIVLGFLFIFAINFYVPLNFDIKTYIGIYLTFFLLSICGILGERFALRCFQISMIKQFYNSKLNQNSIPVLLYGGGFNSLIYTMQTYSYIKETPEKIVGIIDDDASLRGFYVYGVRVLGGIDALDEVFRKKKVKRIVITTTSANEDKLALLEEFCSRNGIELMRLHIDCRFSPVNEAGNNCDKTTLIMPDHVNND